MLLSFASGPHNTKGSFANCLDWSEAPGAFEHSPTNLQTGGMQMQDCFGFGLAFQEETYLIGAKLGKHFACLGDTGHLRWHCRHGSLQEAFWPTSEARSRVGHGRLKAGEWQQCVRSPGRSRRWKFRLLCGLLSPWLLIAAVGRRTLEESNSMGFFCCRTLLQSQWQLLSNPAGVTVTLEF